MWVKVVAVLSGTSCNLGCVTSVSHQVAAHYMAELPGLKHQICKTILFQDEMYFLLYQLVIREKLFWHINSDKKANEDWFSIYERSQEQHLNVTMLE